MRAGVNLPLFTSLHAATDAVALCAAVTLAETGAGAAPDWVHLLPAGDIRTVDGRGPYRVESLNQVIAESLPQGERLVLDANHSTDLAAPMGLPAPAMGWIISLQARADGIWGQVEWTDEGRQLVAGKAYRAISPVIVHDKAGRVLALRRASLVNKPNLKGLTALHQEQDMDLLKKLAAKLGLADSASEDAVLAAIDGQAGLVTALQAQVSAVAKAAGLQEGASQEAVLGAIAKLGSAGDGKSLVALQAELTTVTTELNELKESTARKAAEAFVDGAIKAGRVGVKPLRDHYVSMHMEDAARVEKEIGAMPVLNGQRLVEPGADPRKDAGGKRFLTPEQEQTIQLMGLDRDLFIKTLEAEEQAEAGL